MIVYQADKRQFVRNTFHDDIEAVLSQQYLRTTGRQPSPSEFNAWKHSLFEVGEVLKDPGIPDDIGVALEYTVPQTSKRIDVLLTWEDEAGAPQLVISHFIEKDGAVSPTVPHTQHEAVPLALLSVESTNSGSTRQPR